jgi:hypothetical protein
MQNRANGLFQALAVTTTALSLATCNFGEWIGVLIHDFCISRRADDNTVEFSGGVPDSPSQYLLRGKGGVHSHLEAPEPSTCT